MNESYISFEDLYEPNFDEQEELAIERARRRAIAYDRWQEDQYFRDEEKNFLR